MTAGKRILVVNDTQEILDLFDDILSAQGYDVTLMSFAPDEMAQVTAAKPDLIIIDFVLGGREMEGWQLLQKLRMHPETQRTPILACTAALQQVREQEGYLVQQGIAVVLKPFTIDQLETAVARALETAKHVTG